MFNNIKGIEALALNSIFVVVLAAIVLITLLSGIQGTSSKTGFEKQFHAIDSALFVDSLYAIPREVSIERIYELPKELTLEIKDSKTSVSDADGPVVFSFTQDEQFTFYAGKSENGKITLFKTGNSIGVFDGKQQIPAFYCNQMKKVSGQMLTDAKLLEKIDSSVIQLVSGEIEIQGRVFQANKPKAIIYTNEKAEDFACPIAKELSERLKTSNIAILPIPTVLVSETTLESSITDEKPALIVYVYGVPTESKVALVQSLRGVLS